MPITFAAADAAAPSNTALYKRKELTVVGGILAPICAIIATILFIATGETWSLANVVTVYGGLFGIAATGYAFWKQ